MTTNEQQAPTEVGAWPMSDAEFRCLREHLGLTMEWLADRLDVAERTVRRWEAGTSAVPAGVAEQMREMAEETDIQLDQLVGVLSAWDEPQVETFRTDEDFRAADPPSWWAVWPASWHRALCARVADELPGLRITYWAQA